MTVAIYLAAAVLGCCVVWLLIVCIRPDRNRTRPAWRRVWLPILASTAAVATFLMIRFVADEAPVSIAVVVRGWLGLFVVFSAVFAFVAALMLAVAGRVRLARSHERPQPSAR